MLYTTAGFGMAGCCSSSNVQDCGWAKGCIDYKDYSAGKCDGDCMRNTFVRKCTSAAAPYCASWTYAHDDVKDYGCGTDSVSTYETVYQQATDTVYDESTSMALSTVSGKAVTGYADSSTASASASNTDTDTNTNGNPAQATSGPSNHTTTTRRKKKIPLGLILGAAAAGLFVIALAIGLAIFFCVNAKKKKTLAANQQAITAAQANRAQSAHNQAAQPLLQQPPPQPQLGMNDYFKPPPQQQQQPYDPYNPPADPQKFNPQTQVHEYAAPPISNPGTPAPAYTQPYYAMTPPPPTQSPAPYHNRELPSGVQEVEAVSMLHAQPGPQSHMYEMGGR